MVKMKTRYFFIYESLGIFSTLINTKMREIAFENCISGEDTQVNTT